MSDQTTYVSDLLLDDALDEVFHGGPEAALADKILRAAAAPAHSGQGVETSGGKAFQPVLLTRKGQPPSDFEAVPSLPRWAYRLAQAAVAAGLLLLVAVLVMPRDPQPPQGVIADEDAEFDYDPDVEWPEVTADAGWYVLSDGAPPLTAAGSRVEDVKGMVIVKVGDIPNPDELAAQQPWFSQHQVETQMSGNWIKAGALSLMIVTGSAFVDGNYVSAEKNAEKRREADKKEVDKKEVEKRENDKKEVEKEESAEDRLARLREEIADLERRLEEAREIEDEKTRKAKLERIENALKDKRAELDKAEDRAAGERDKKEDDGAAKKRREAERRKNADKDEDAAAKERREAERRKKDGGDTKTDEELRKAREEAERRKKEERQAEDGAEKERKEDARKEEEGANKKRESDKRGNERKDARKQ